MKVFRKIPFVILLLPLVAAILIMHYHEKSSSKQAEDMGEKPSAYIWQAQITSVPQTRAKTMKAEAKLVWRKDSLSIKKADERVILYIRRDSASEALQQGDSVLLYGAITHSNRGNPYEFDYDSWLRQQGIAGVIFLDKTEWILTGHKDIYTPKAIADRCRRWFVNILQEHDITGTELGVVAAMTVGEREELDNETRRQYSAAGAMHVLAVSGLHTGIVYWAIMFLLTGFGYLPVLYEQKRRKWITAVVCVLCLWCYAFLTGMSPSVMRASLMITVFLTGYAFGRNNISANTIAAAAFFNLLFEPEALFSVSFQLSYAAVLGIIMFYWKISGLFHVKIKVLRWLWQLFSVSIAAQIGTLPITLWYFQQASNWFALTNILVIPLAYVIICFSFVLVLFSATPIACIASYPLKYSAWLMNKGVGWIEGLPGSTTNISITVGMICSLILAIIFIGIWIHRGKYVWFGAGITMLAIMLVLHFFHLRDINKVEQTIVYNTYPYTLVLHQEGRACTLLTDSIEAAMQVSEPLRKHMMIRRVDTTCFAGKEVAAYTCGGRQLLFLMPEKGHRIEYTNNPPADVLLIGGRGETDIEKAVVNTALRLNGNRTGAVWLE